MDNLDWIEEYSKTDTCELHGHVNAMISVMDNDDYLKSWTKDWYEKNIGFTHEGYYDEYYSGYEIYSKDIIGIEVECVERYDGSHTTTTYVDLHSGEEIEWEEVQNRLKPI
jgi:hypothetical protein